MKKINQNHQDRMKLTGIAMLIAIMVLGINIMAQEDTDLLAQKTSLYSDLKTILSKGFQSTKNGMLFQQHQKYKGYSYDHYMNEYKKATAQRKLGGILIAAGGGSVLTGLIAAYIAFGTGQDSYADAQVYMGSGVVLFCAGILTMNVGFGFSIAGTIKKNKNMKAMVRGWPEPKATGMSLSFGTTNDGLGLAMKF